MIINEMSLKGWLKLLELHILWNEIGFIEELRSPKKRRLPKFIGTGLILGVSSLLHVSGRRKLFGADMAKGIRSVRFRL